jgi:Leucine-rich repeat (LRR) protein
MDTVVALSLYSNNATGIIPTNALEQLVPWLVFLDLRNNHISGPVPEVLSRASHLKWLLLDNNKFTGTLPVAYSALLNLTSLALSENHLTGTLPLSYTKLSRLRSIELDKNCLTGEFPVEFFTLEGIEVRSFLHALQLLLCQQ